MTLNNTTDLSCSEDDDSFVLNFMLIVGGWSSVVTCISGLLANTFSIIILANKRMRTLSTNIYLMALAVVNLLWLILFLGFSALRLTIIVPYFISGSSEYSYSFVDEMYHRLSPYALPLMNTLQLCIIYYTVAVSVDRCLYVSMGLNASHYCSVRNALRVILCLTIFAILFIIPHWLRFCVTTEIGKDNQTQYKLSYTSIGKQKLFREIVHVYVYIPVVYVIPFITLICINGVTVRRLIQYHDEHRRLLTNSARQRNLMRTNFIYSGRHHHVTIMLIGIVLLFLLCRFPMLINQLYEVKHPITESLTLKDNGYFHCRIQRTFNTFANFMQTINANGNLIVYLLCSQNFRNTSQELFERLLVFLRLKSNENTLVMMYRRSRASTRSTEM